MKKINILVATVLAAFTLQVSAGEFMEATYTPAVKNQATKQVTGDALGITVGTSKGPFALDGKFDATRARGTGVLGNTLQARGTFEVPVAQYGSVFARGGLGRSWQTDYSFYTYAGGAKVNLPNDFKWLFTAERNNAMKAGNPKFTTYETGFSYDVTKKDAVALMYERNLGDVNTGALKVGYSRAF